jgi:hypothetical protein
MAGFRFCFELFKINQAKISKPESGQKLTFVIQLKGKQ